MAETDQALAALAEAGVPIEVVQLPTGQWEARLHLEDSPTTLFARGDTRDAAVEHALQVMLPALILRAISNYLKRNPNPVELRGTSSLTSDLRSLRQTDAQQFGGFGILVRFRREPDDSWSWGVFDEKTGEGMSAGVADDLEYAKLDAIMKLLPPNTFE